jgi:Rad3-related DNA helicase
MPEFPRTLSEVLATPPKNEPLAETFFQHGVELLKRDRDVSLNCLNNAVRYGSFRPEVYAKRAEVLFLEKRFYECCRDVDLALVSPAPPKTTTSLVAMKTECLLKLGCPHMALSFITLARKCFKNADFSKKSKLRRLRKVAKNGAAKETACVDDEASKFRPALFPDKEEMLRRVKRWTPTDGRKIGGGTVSAALDLRRNENGLDFVAVRDIKAGE